MINKSEADWVLKRWASYLLQKSFSSQTLAFLPVWKEQIGCNNEMTNVRVFFFGMCCGVIYSQGKHASVPHVLYESTTEDQQRKNWRRRWMGFICSGVIHSQMQIRFWFGEEINVGHQPILCLSFIWLLPAMANDLWCQGFKSKQHMTVQHVLTPNLSNMAARSVASSFNWWCSTGLASISIAN